MSIPIQPLTDEQIASLVAHIPGTMVQYIQTRAAGNPFFAEELARTVETQITPAASNAESAQDTHTLAHKQVNVS
ncbi:MAG TPA: hypothetical protein DHV65_19005, partial [Ktedonobacter sp.]|nr:hypothetical protein [Ktedonobacter sp.]